MKKFKLRDYQADDLKRINKEIKAGHKRVLYSLMTAGGKTVVLHEQVSRWLRKGLRGCVLVHTRALLNQTCAAFSDIPHGVIAGGIKSDPDKKLQICMVQSLARRGGKAFDFIVVDEAHHATASTWAKILADSPEAIILGVTATPFRHDNRGLGQAGFTTLVEGPEVSWLTEQGFLSPVEYYAPTDIDMTGVKKVGGDYEKKESSRRANKPTITGSAVEHYKRHANGQRALVFCADIKHVLSVTKKFKKAGLNAAFIHGKMATDEREDVLLQFAESKDMILVSCELIGEGLDVPAVACVILLRPTASLVRFIQQVGRGLRVVDGKKHVVVLDHVGNIRLGHPHVRREVDLNGVEKKAKNLDENSPKSYLRTCPKCRRVETADVAVCSTCGHKFRAVVRGHILNRDGSLLRIDGWTIKGPNNLIRIRLSTPRKGRNSRSYLATINNKTYTIGDSLECATKTRDKIYDWFCLNNCVWPPRNDLDLLVDRTKRECGYVLRGYNLCSEKINDIVVYRINLGGKRFSLGPNKKQAELAHEFILERLYENGFDVSCLDTKTVVAEAIFRCCENFLPINSYVKMGKNRYYQFTVKQISCGRSRDKKTTEIVRSKFVQFFEFNNFEWPSAADIKALNKRLLFESHKPSLVGYARGRKTEYFIGIGGARGLLGTNLDTANAARDHLLKFYESNNYEWPPKSEVPALVKRALEHAKSTVE